MEPLLDEFWWWWLKEGVSGLPYKEYFAFVEDVSDISEDAPIDAPGGGNLDRDHPVFKINPTRFRMSGVEVHSFLDGVSGFEFFGDEPIDAADRKRRRVDLRRFFEGTPIPVIDVFLSREKDEFYSDASAAFLPTSWHRLIIVEHDPKESMRPVYRGEPYATAPGGEFPRGFLAGFLPVREPHERWLRDIFSLNHVPDAQIEGGPTGGGAPPDSPPPFDPGPGGDRDWIQRSLTPSDRDERDRYRRDWQATTMKLQNQ